MNLIDAPFMRGFIRLTAEACRRGWHERNGGNLSYRLSLEDIELIKAHLARPETWTPIGIEAPELAGELFLVTGSGRFLRNVRLNPEENLALVLIDPSGRNYSPLWGLSAGGRPSSELPTHLLSQAVKKRLTGGRHRVFYHAHPPNLIAMTFVLPLTDRDFTRELWAMATECPVIFPEGVGVLPWMVPGGGDIALATGRLMEKYNAAVWAHHGLVCSGSGFDETFGLMETVEKSAEIWVKVQALGGRRRSITGDNFRALARDFRLSLPEEFLD